MPEQNSNIKTKASKNKWKIITTIFATLSVFCIIFLWNNLNEARYPLNFDTDGVRVHHQDGDYEVMIDDQYSRLTILKNGDVVRILQDSEHEQGKKAYFNAKVSNGKIYYHDVEMRGHTQFIAKEKIIVLDLNGDYLGKVYELDYGEDVLDAYPPRIVDFNIKNDIGVLLYCERINAKIQVITFNPDPNDDSWQWEYYDTVNFASAINDIYIYDGTVDIDFGLVAVSTLYGDVYACNKYYNDQPINKISDHNDQYALSVTYDDCHNLIVNSEFLMPDTSLYYSAPLIIKTILIWLSFLYLTVFVIVRIVLLIVGLKRTRQLKRLSHLAITIVSVITILLICIFYSWYSIDENYKTKASNISVQADNVARLQTDNINDCIKDFTSTGKVSFENYKKLYDNLTIISENYSRIDESAHFTLYAYGPDDNLYLLITSALYYPSGLPYFNVYDSEDEVFMLWEQKNYYVFDGFRDNYIASVEQIKGPNDEIIGLFSAETNYDLFVEKNRTNFINLFITLVVVITSILLIVVEFYKMLQAFKLRKKAIKLKEKVPEIHIARILFFLIIFAFEVDSSLMVLIAKDMLVGASNIDEGLLLSLPALFHSAGMVFGVIFFIGISSRFSTKKLGALSGLGLVVFNLLTAYAVFVGNFWLFLFGKFFAIFCLAQIYSIPNGLITQVNNEKTIANISIDMTVASLSAGILAMMFAGYIAQYISNWCIYVMAAVPCIGVILLFMFLFSNKSIKSLDIVIKNEKNKSNKNSNNNNESMFVEMLKFYFSKNTFCFVFLIMGISTITFAYRAYLFPLLGDSIGWDKSTISNIMVLANIFVFLVVPVISNMTKNVDYWKVTIICMIASGVVFIMLIIREIPATIIFVMVAITVLNKLINSYFSVILVRESEAKGVHKTKANVILLILRDGFGAIKAPIASALFSIGTVAVYGAFAIASVAGATIFGFVTKDSAMNADRNKAKKTSRTTKNQKSTSQNKNI